MRCLDKLRAEAPHGFYAAAVKDAIERMAQGIRLPTEEELTGINQITVAAAAKLLKVTPVRVRQYVADGRIRAKYLTPRMMLVDRRDVEGLVKFKPHGRAQGT